MNPGFRFFGPRWRDWWRRMLKGVDDVVFIAASPAASPTSPSAKRSRRVRVVVLLTIVGAAIAVLANLATIATFVMSLSEPSTPPPESSSVSAPLPSSSPTPGAQDVQSASPSARGPSLSRDVWNSKEARRALRLLDEAEAHYDTGTWASALESYRQAYEALPAPLRSRVNTAQLNKALVMSGDNSDALPQAVEDARKAIEGIYLELKKNQEVVR